MTPDTTLLRLEALAEIEARHNEWETPEKKAGLIGLTWEAGDQAHSDRAYLLATIRELRANQRTPGTVEVCAVCRKDSPFTYSYPEHKEAGVLMTTCQMPSCPIRQVTP